jgi:predicted RecB family endonuclease
MSMGHIWNKDLFDDPRDWTIAMLRKKITEFKAYDQQRKDYYKSVIEENERMKQELEDRKTSEKDELIKKLRARVNALNIKLTNYGLSMDGVDADEIARMREENRLNAWKLQIKRLNAEVRRLKDENFTLIYKLNQEKEKNKK